MRILYHHRTQARGAAGCHIREMVKAFEKYGYIVNIMSPLASRSYSKVTAGSQKKYRYIIPQIIFELFEILYNFIDIIGVSFALSRKKYAAIYERYAIFNVAGVMASKLFRIPIILEVSFTSKTSVFPTRTKILSPFAYLVDKFIFKNANGIIVVSSVLKENLINNFHVGQEKIIVIHNAANPDVFTPRISSAIVKAKYGLDSNKIIGFAGGFYPWHGLNLLLDAAERVLKKYPDVKFLLIGDGPMRDELKRRVEQSLLKDAVIFTGSVPHNELPNYIAAFDIGVMPDSNNYGSPIKIFEYMLMGKPVLAPRLRPIEEVIKNGETGILFQQKSEEELSKCIAKLLTDENLCRRISLKAQKEVLENHIWEKHVEHITAKWKDVFFKED